MTAEEFKQTLLEIRDQATREFIDAVEREAPTERALVDATHRRSLGDGDPLTVWHAAEVALGMLDARYLPKREALQDARARMEWWPASAEG